MQNEKSQKNKLIRILIYVSILFALTSVGTVAGYFYYASTETVYLSQATIFIETKPLDPEIVGLDFSSVSDVRHDQLIPQADLVTEALGKHKLLNLKCFDDLPKDSVVASVVENLEVTQNEVEPSLYNLSLRSSRPGDSQTILHILVATYGSRLDKQQELIFREYESGLLSAAEKIEILIKISETIGEQEISEQELAQANQTKVEIQSKLSALSLAKLTNNGLSGVAELKVLQPATYGESVWPVLPLLLAVGAAIGFAVGMMLILFSLLLEKLAG